MSENLQFLCIDDELNPTQDCKKLKFRMKEARDCSIVKLLDFFSS